MTTLDARTLRCPLPVLRLAAAARQQAPGSRITVLATDPVARIDLPSYARAQGWSILAEQLDGEDYQLTIQL